MAINKGGISKEVREQFQKKLDDRLESNAEYQRRKLMTREEKGRDCIDRLTRLNLESAQKSGRQMTEREARLKAEQAQNNYDRKR